MAVAGRVGSATRVASAQTGVMGGITASRMTTVPPGARAVGTESHR
jgi:hypothetical protein